MGSAKLSLRRLFVGIGTVAALTGLTVLVTPSASANPAGSGVPAIPMIPQSCQVGPSSSADSFEEPTAPAGRFSTLPAGAAIGPWAVTQNNVDLMGAGSWQAADGVQSVDLSGSVFPFQGAVARTFATDGLPLPLFTYIVTFCLAGNPDSGPAVKTGQVLLNGTPVKDFSFDVTGKSPADMGYRLETLSFTSKAAEAEIEFVSTTNTAYGPVIDKVRFHKCLLGLICS
jgi:choice-of-anchor C domain-containing protein